MPATSPYLNRPPRNETETRQGVPPLKDDYRSHCRSAAGRNRLLARLQELATEVGATLTRGEFDDPTEIHVTLTRGPYAVSTWLNGRSNVGAFLGHWHTELRSGATYPRDFAAAIDGTLNTCHFGKATTCENSFAAFLESLRAGFRVLAEIRP